MRYGYKHALTIVFLCLSSLAGAQQTPQYLRIENEGALLTRRFLLNFIGAGVNCVDNASFERTDCTIGGGGGGGSNYQTLQQSGSALPQEPVLNFTGAGINCVDDPGSTRSTCTIGGAFYQTMQSNTVGVTQRSALNFSTAFGLTDSSSPSRTTVDLANVISGGSCTNCNITYDAKGRVTVAANGSAGSGTVTSVGLSMPSIMSVAGSPVTTSGTLAVTLATQAANVIFAGPTSGGVATPTFRALVAADIPSLASTYLPLAGGTMASGADIISAGGVGDIDYTLSSGTWTAPTGGIRGAGLTIAETSGGSGALTLTSVNTDPIILDAGGITQCNDVFTEVGTNYQTTYTSAIIAQNSTAATNPIQVQYGGAIMSKGTAWDTAATNDIAAGIVTRPVAGATVNVILDFVYAVGGATPAIFGSIVRTTGGSAILRFPYLQQGSATSQLIVPATGSNLLSDTGAATVTGKQFNGLTATGSTAIDFSGSSAAMGTTTGTFTFNGPISIASGIDETAAGGVSDWDWSASSGVWKSPTGINTFAGSANNFTNPIVETNASNIGTAQTPGFTLANTTAATLGAQQYSPGLVLSGQGNGSTVGNNDKTTKWMIQGRPVQGSSQPDNDLVFWSSIAGVSSGNFVEKMKVNVDAFTSTTITTPGGPVTIREGVGNNGLSCQNAIGGCAMQVGGSNKIQWTTSTLIPASDFGISSGDGTHRWSSSYARHDEFGQAAKPTCATGAGAGTGSPSCTVTTNSTDSKGIVTVTLGTTPTGGATLVTVTFNTAYSIKPFCTLTPANAAAADNPTMMPFPGTTTTTTLPLTTPTVAYTTGAPAFAWDCDATTSN